jgi:fatty-acyl-CoA synthase
LLGIASPLNPPDSGDDALAASVLAYLGTKLAKFMVPDAVRFVAELPHTATGKISKLKLRQQLLGLPTPNPKAKL